MFSVYSVQGRIFNGTLEQWRQVARVSAPARTHAIRPSTQESRKAAIDERPSGGGAGEAQRAAMAAYTQTQQGAAPRHPLSRVHEVMSRNVITVPHEATLAQAWQLLAQHAIGQAPAVDATGALVGLLLRADLLQPGLLPGPGPDPQAWRDLLAQRVSDLMWTPVPSVASDTDIRRVTVVLLETGLPGLPVVNDQGAVTGFISRSDILRAVVADPPLELWA
ncbi:MAG: CBS domain-containing protein [Burkholderiaceae bacterium]|nr:CBS domain-containing protein [Burkholderiaceae bacterium]